MTSSAIPHVKDDFTNLVTEAPADSLSGASKLMLGAGVLALIASIVLAFVQSSYAFYEAYLVSYMFTLSLAVGALFFVMIQHVARAGWSIVVRRLAENMAIALPVLAILFIPIYVGKDYLYHHWIHPAPDDHVIEGKAGYLNVTFFTVRIALYFVIWSGAAWFFRKNSIKQDETGDPGLSITMAKIAAPAIVLSGFAITFAAIDWMMSIDAHWFSTMFGVTYFAGSMMSFFAMMAMLLLFLRKKNLLADTVNTEHYHDIGKLMFAFMIFWSYVTFSQYFLIQYADLPEETGWFKNRLLGNWGTIGTILCVGHFLFPFAFLLSRHMKRNRTPLAIGAVLLLAMHWLDLKYIIDANFATVDAKAPNGQLRQFSIGLQDIVTMIALPCIFLGVTLKAIAGSALIPVRDPKLRESLKFQNI